MDVPRFTKVILEVNSDCNRRCHFCNRHGDSKNRFFDTQGKLVSRFMPLGQIENIRQQLVDMEWEGEVFFGHMSEPTMDPGIVDIVSSFAQHDWPITFHTNGDFLRKDDLLSHELSQVVDRFVVGIYDVEGKTKQEIAQQKQWWKKRLAPANVIFSVATTRFERRFSLEEDKRSFPNAGCTAQLLNLVIYYDGEVALCCEDINCEFDLGNVFETPILDIWESSERFKLAARILNKRSNHPVCAACPIVPTG